MRGRGEEEAEEDAGEDGFAVSEGADGDDEDEGDEGEEE